MEDDGEGKVLSVNLYKRIQRRERGGWAQQTARFGRRKRYFLFIFSKSFYLTNSREEKRGLPIWLEYPAGDNKFIIISPRLKI
ncbi:hypothetical protein V2J09_007131 [Rumex salicifolius]